MEATFKKLFTILDPCTHQVLSNHKTLSTILSGATVPLKKLTNEKSDGLKVAAFDRPPFKLFTMRFLQIGAGPIL